MKLPFFFTKKPQQYFFGLLLKENKGIGYILSGDGKKLKLQGKKEFSFSNGWDRLTEDVDEVLFKLENETKTRVEKTIFFLYSHFLDPATKEIIKPRLQKIKELSKNLEIKPLGYIECYEAVAAYVQKKEDMPLTSILIELDDSFIDVFVYKGGHKMHSYIVSRSAHIIDDLHEAFDVVGKNTLLPNRLILYNSSNLVDESTKIISYKWSPELFVQLPRVEILHEDNIFDGLVTIFEKQIYNQDQMIDKNISEEELPQKEVMGFVIGEDVSESMKEPVAMDMTLPQKDDRSSMNSFIHSLWNTVIRTLSSFHFTLNKPNKWVVWLGICSFFIIVLFSLFEIFLHKAHTTIFFSSFPLTKQLTVTDFTILSATSSSSLQDVRVTTGKRDIGEKATGEVTLYNFDDKDKTFERGTTIQTDNLSFTLNDSVKVAAATLATDASAKLPGKSKVKVTAVDIGTDSNLEKGKRFKISDLSPSVFFALNESGFSGGTKKSIKTVSKKDMEELESSLLQKAKEEQKDKIWKESNKEITLIDKLISFDLSDVVFSKELGEESDTISLKAKALTQYRYFNTQQMKEYLMQHLSSSVQAGYELKERNISFTITNAKESNRSVDLILNIKAQATRKVDVSAIKTDMTLESTDQFESRLKKEIGAASVTIQVLPNLPVIQNILPLFKKNITISIESI